jgi:predicted GIY-YIG superfamily endonuclease
MYYVYVLRSQLDGGLYVGYTTNLRIECENTIMEE